MKNHKLVTIFIFVFFKHDKNVFFLLENMHEKPLKFDHIHENKTYFSIFEMRNFFFEFLKVFEISEKIIYF